MPSPEQIKVVLADDHQVTRLGIKFMLEQFTDLLIVGEAADGQEAVNQFDELKPDVILMDVDMPGLSGIDAARQIRNKHDNAKIIMMTSSKEEKNIFASLAAGASGYCTKDISKERLKSAIESVLKGDMWLDSAIAGSILKLMPEPADVTTPNGKDALTQREIDVLKLIVDGASNNMIAQKLFISADTVKSHIKHILDKLSVTDRTQAAVKALKDGLV